MFSAARCSLPLHPQPHAGSIPYRRPSHGSRAPTAVSAAPRRRSTRGPRRGSSWDDGGSDSDADDRIDADFFGEDQDDDDDDEPPPPTRAASPEPQLRGTDVLRALQRAAAAKEAKKKKDRKPAAQQRQGKETVKGGGGEVAVDGEVRPVAVKPEWAARIRELELRVQQLADKYQ
ncbi:hypothetical protein PR202_ga18275 [Eleusine coracana subsp. coracana]|uniref:Uncharacterized protein n=1 Tax=Eleusine coracana subsp. coracana TaxID=191504 RepID=A0AAV5CSP0_ELECO|nr:hypothetical protein QOZ80_6AG0507440 [Eleusine coracana subsp. coracana]GJN01041.1 hypothetical protein PR202_ga18275 [Eleusine coracana subsp. coracana]